MALAQIINIEVHAAPEDGQAGRRLAEDIAERLKLEGMVGICNVRLVLDLPPRGGELDGSLPPEGIS